jgi:hypothetical protein
MKMKASKAKARTKALARVLLGEPDPSPPTEFVVSPSLAYGGAYKVSVCTMRGGVAQSTVELSSLDEYRRFMRRKAADAGIKVRSLRIRFEPEKRYDFMEPGLQKDHDFVLNQAKGAFS